MNTIHFALAVKSAIIVKMTGREVVEISIGGNTAGYIAVNNIGEQNIVTPFTSKGELIESHCRGCALRELIAYHTNLNAEALQPAIVENERQSVAGSFFQSIIDEIKASKSVVN